MKGPVAFRKPMSRANRRPRPISLTLSNESWQMAWEANVRPHWKKRWRPCRRFRSSPGTRLWPAARRAAGSRFLPAHRHRNGAPRAVPLAGKLGAGVGALAADDEIAAGGGRRRYRALQGQRRALACAARPRPTKLGRCPRLREEVAAGLGRRWSPQQISARLKLDHPEDPEMRISHETIYQSLYVQSRGELRRELTRALRSGRTKRRGRREGPERRGRIPAMVSISERPAEVADRAVPGHWEGDLLVGRSGRSFIATLVERQTRYLLLARLGNDGSADHVTRALAGRITELPEHLVLSLTWDQARSSPSMPASASRPGSRSTSAIPTRPGSEARTRTPTAFCANTCPRAATWPCTARSSSTGSRPS
jgi:hypothetical protein